MPDEPFMLVSLEEAKAKKLAQVLNNETCTKILNYLSTHKESTESDLAKKLKLPLSTVHYNLKQLVEARLVLADEYHYSEKGREVNHYKLANKYIIIAPQEDQGGFLDKLKQFIPAALIVVGVGAVLKVLNLLTGTASFTASSDIAMAKSAPLAAPLAERAMDEGVAAGAHSFAEETVADTALNAANGTNVTAHIAPAPMPYPDTSGIMPGGCIVEPTLREQLFSNPLILSFVVGGLFAIFLIALFTYLRKRKK